jgi:hypothetical protein
LYYFNEKRFLIVFLLLVRTLCLFSQEKKAIPDSVASRTDTLMVSDTISTDSVPLLRGISPNAIESKVTYAASGRIRNDLVNQRVYLIRDASVQYEDIEIKADSIVFSKESNLVYAVGTRDTTGKVIGKPVFKSGSQEFEADTLWYNFETEKARIRNIVTKQDQGLLRSSVTKLLEDGTSNIYKSTYSTCDAPVPHFYINLKKARVYPGKKIISGPGNLVLAGIPLPLFLPFGYFPIQKKLAASGILIPRIGQEVTRGYSLTDGGYYFAVSPYFDLAFRGNIYTNGSWMGTATSNYNKLYKYSGTFSFSYANNVSGHKGLTDYSKQLNYSLGWTYNQSPKAWPGSRFSANVSMRSSEFDRNNSYQVMDHVTTDRMSSINYSKTWEGTPFNLSASMNQNQNVRNKTMKITLPNVQFNMGRIYPFRFIKSTGRTKWYQDIQFQYNASLQNEVNTYDSLLFKREVWSKMHNGFRHEAPVSLQIRPFRNFTISPAVTYTGVLYSQKIDRIWNPAYYDVERNQVSPRVINDTIQGFFYGQAIRPSISAGFNPQIFGTYTFINPNSKIQAIRHVIKPSVSFSYIPALNGLSTDMYRTVQTDTSGTKREYSIFEGQIFGTPSLSQRSGNVSFSLINLVEAKIFDRNDTTGKPKKVKIIDNMGITTSYNIFADSLRWSPVNMVMRTTLFNKINISANSSFSLYETDSRGVLINRFLLSDGKLMRLNNFSTSLDFSLSELLSGKGGQKPPAQSTVGMPGQNSYQETGQLPEPASPNPNQVVSGFDQYGYAVFNVPWSLNISYSLNYAKTVIKTYSPVRQSLSFNGFVTLTKKMNITYTSGYDFEAHQITMTNIGITRDLHCWEMMFNWIPNGSMKMWNFTLRVKASVLRDLKFERRKDYHDTY